MSITRRQFLASSALLVPAGLRAADAPTGLVVGQVDGAIAGNAMLADGGNAVDAIVTAALVAGVVALPMTGLGGYGGALVVRKSDGSVATIDFNGTAPTAANAVHNHGWLAAGVPGVLAGLQAALDQYGRKKFPQVVTPAVKLARDGFTITKSVATAIKAAKERFAKDPGSAKLHLHNGEPRGEGEIFRNPDLAAMLEVLAAKGRVDDFYQGGIAAKIAAAFKANGGLVTAADLAAFTPLTEPPLILGWQNHVIHTAAPTAGGLTVLQALHTLKALAWEKMEFKDPLTTQARVEALRLAWHDRLALIGDPKHTKSPVEKLLSAAHAAVSAETIRVALKAGKPVAASTDGRPSNGTIHLNAIDASGMAAALTFTHGEAFGAQVTVDGLGLTLGHGMSRFDPRPGRPNSIAPGKRPLHNMCPTIVTRDGTVTLALGATGGRRIPNTVFEVLCRRLGEGSDLAAAVKAPRLHTEGDLNLKMETTWPAAVTDHLKKVGYTITPGGNANFSAIERNATGTVTSAIR